MSFRKFISSLRPVLQSGECNQFVLGNSGADYDSVVGSLIYAFYLTTSLKITHLPLIDCSKQDLNLRFQIMTVFDDLQIKKDDLIYTNMVKDLYGVNNTFALYDHNTRPEINSSRIFEIVDHHAYEEQKIKCNHIISHCGSALTLLYYLYNPSGLQKFQGKQLYTKYMKYFDSKKETKIIKISDEETINQLFYSGIMIDTYGLNKNQAQVWNQFDQNAILELEQKINPRFNFDQLAQSKFDKQKNLKLSLQQHRKKDYKCISYGEFKIHYSTVLLDIRLFIDAYWSQIVQQMPINQIGQNQLYAFMFSFPSAGKTDITQGNFKKFILFTGSNQGLIDKLQNIMAGLKFLQLQDRKNWKIWEDPTGKISRKIFDKELRSKL